MLIRLGYDIDLELSRPMTVIAVLNVHRSRVADLVEPDEVRVAQCAARDEYVDTFGNRCTRIHAHQGTLRLWNSTLIRDSGAPDPRGWNAEQILIEQLPYSEN